MVKKIEKLFKSYREQLLHLAKLYGVVEIKKLLQDEAYLHELLKKGTKKADLIAKNNLKEIYDIIGLTKFT